MLVVNNEQQTSDDNIHTSEDYGTIKKILSTKATQKLNKNLSYELIHMLVCKCVELHRVEPTSRC